MRTLSTAYLTAAKSAGRYPNVKAVVYESGTENTLALDGKNEIIEVHISKGDLSKPSYYETMRALSSECKITIDRRRLQSESLLVKGNKIEVFAAFNRPDGVEIGSALLGTFFVTSYTKSDQAKGIINACDALLYAGADFDPEEQTITYPASLSTLLGKVFAQSGVSVTVPTLDLDPCVLAPPYQADTPVAQGMHGCPYSCREIAARIAAMQMAPMFINADGNPAFFAYGNVITGAITSAMIYSAEIGTSTFELEEVIVCSSSERLRKAASSYQKMSYSPYFYNMDPIITGSIWATAAEAKADEITEKPWTNATVVMQGVGEIELGDRVQVEGADLCVMGIMYDFVNAHFTETLYSYAWTEEEYLKIHQTRLRTTTAGSDTSWQTYTSVTDPAQNTDNIIKPGDRWTQINNTTDRVEEQTFVRKTDDTTGVDGWELEKKPGGGSGGVGEAVGNHSERFNYYGTEYGINTLDDTGGGMANRAGGQRNQLTSCQFTDVYGITNSAEYTRCAVIRGDGIKIGKLSQRSYLDCFIAVGSTIDNYDTTSQSPAGAPIEKSALFGTNLHVRAPLRQSIVAGDDININAMTYQSIVSGQGHRINSQLLNSIIGGERAAVGTSMRLVIGNGTSTSPSNAFQVDRYGDVLARSYNTLNADYAEMFEWADGNPEKADRRGMLVTLYEDKIVPAHGDEFTGIVSATPSVVGNNPQHWHKRFKKDVFGTEIRDEKGERIESDEYDPNQEYIPRSERPEWAAVGMIGRLVIVDDGSCKVGGYVSARHGIGTKCYAKTAAKVLKRIDEKHVEVLLKAGW